MQELVEYLEGQGGFAASMMEAARVVGPNGSLRYGYATIHRAVKAGLVRVDPSDPRGSTRGKGALVLV